MKKLLLCALGTNRDGKRVRFAAGTVADLTKDELADLDKLTEATGKLHYRTPVNESGPADAPEVVDVPDFAGQDVAMGNKSVDQLKAYLTFHDVAFDKDDKKADLLTAAEGHAKGTPPAADPDAGL